MYSWLSSWAVSAGGFLTRNSYPLSMTSCLLAIILILGHYYYKQLFKFWTKQGLKGPKPYPVVGNLVELIMSNRMVLENKWRDSYGKLYGVFMGHKARIVVADPEVLRQVCIKDFDHFPNHEPNAWINEYQKHFIFFIQDDHWKRVRSMLTPTFTSGKIKRMFTLLNVCADDLVECFNEQIEAKKDEKAQGVTVNVKDLYSLFTMDAIASCCYGLKLERSGSTDLKSAAQRNEFVSISLKLFELNLPRILTVFTIPKPILQLFNFKLTPKWKMDPLGKRVEQIIKARRASGRKFDDYLQLLLDAKFNDKMELNEMDQQENHHAGLTHKSLIEDQERMVKEVEINKPNREATEKQQSTGVAHGKIELTEQEILSNAIFLLMVGLETTATALTHTTYTLAFHQEIQNKLYEVIKSITEYDVDKKTFTFDYDKLTSCQYLDSVICETLRTLSPVIQLDRVCAKDYRIEKYNVDVKKGSKLNLAFYAIMNDPDSWPNPEKFDPERFMPGNRENIVPGSYCPFGLGPRHCLGMRFSLTETKLALAKMIMTYRMEPAPGMKYPPEPKLTFGLNGIKKPLVNMIKRA